MRLSLILDIRNEFGDYIIDNFVDEYISRVEHQTPVCFVIRTLNGRALLKRADQLGCQYIATGHYAQVRKRKWPIHRFKGIDEWKDQSYVLWGLSPTVPQSNYFPMGKYHKDDIKQMAIDRGYEALAQKPESYEICFIPDNDYRGFLKRRIEVLSNKSKEFCQHQGR